MRNYKKEIYDRLGIDNNTIPSWKTNDYSADLKVSLKIQEYAMKADSIIILGDYDADGICASHILKRSMEEITPDKDITILLPTRPEGYGINRRMVDFCKQEASDKTPLVITCDTGIAAKEYLEEIKSAGCNVILTDHHELKDRNKLPCVDLIIDPEVSFIDNPLSGTNWCGAGVAFKLMENIISLQTRNYCLAFAGIATVADMITLREGSWQLVKNAIDSLKVNAPVNILLLTHELGRDLAHLTTDDIGFYIAPTFNAAGRLEGSEIHTDGALQVIDFLENPTREKAKRLVEINDYRKVLDVEEVEKVDNLIKEQGKELDYPIWIYAPGLHKGLVGLVAGFIKEKYNAPVCVCTDNEDKTMITGSARSVDGFNIYDYLDKNKDCFIKYGGHEGGAGFSLTKENFEEIEKRVEKRESIPKRKIDAIPIELNDIPHINRITNELRPFGEGFSEPVFSADIDLTKQENVSMLGEEKKHLSIRNTTPKWKLIHFGHTESDLTNYEKFKAYGKVHSSYFKEYMTPEMSVRAVEDEPVNEYDDLEL